MSRRQASITRQSRHGLVPGRTDAMARAPSAEGARPFVRRGDCLAYFRFFSFFSTCCSIQSSRTWAISSLFFSQYIMWLLP